MARSIANPLCERLGPGTILRNRDGGGNFELTHFCKIDEAAQPQQAQARRFARGENGILTVFLASLTNVPKRFLCEEAILPSRNGVFIEAIQELRKDAEGETPLALP